MSNINFVPDDYIQNNESCRTNLIYIILFIVVMAGLSICFGTIKIRQKAYLSQEKIVNEKMIKAQEEIAKFEQMQTKRKEMMKTALMISELIEPVPRSVLLAFLTNDLPKGASLIKVGLDQEKAKSPVPVAKAKSKFDASKKGAATARLSQESLLTTNILIEGVAPSDLQVASYIRRLTGSLLLDNVALVESKECKVDSVRFRQFKLTAVLRKGIRLAKEDIEEIKMKCNNAAYNL